MYPNATDYWYGLICAGMIFLEAIATDYEVLNGSNDNYLLRLKK